MIMKCKGVLRLISPPHRDTIFSLFLFCIVQIPLLPITSSGAATHGVPVPYATIQAAIDAADPGDVVQVASSGSPYEENIVLKSGVEVIGAGFGITTIQGDGSGWVVTADGVDDKTLIEGFTITGGKGGIRCKNAELTIARNHITGNQAFMGGGIYVERGVSPSSPVIRENSIDNNTADYGGGICSDYADPAIQGNDIFENHTINWGAGIFMQDSSGTITENNIYLNTAGETAPVYYAGWGAGIFCDGSSTTISGNVIDQNSATAHGGGIHCGNSIYAPTKRNPTITQNTISNNQAAVWGGGICAYPAVSPVIQRNSIINNSAENGAGIYIADASCFFVYASIVNNVIYGNMADGSGGGIYLINLTENGEPDIINNTFFGNYAATSGGGIHCNSSFKPRIFNCILWGNTDDLDGCSTTYSDVQDGDGNGTNGNISINPLLKDTLSGDCSLASRSPCLDAGTDTGAPVTDRDGSPRPSDGNNDGTARADMGAYESVGYEGPVTIHVSTTGNDTYGKGDSLSPLRTATLGLRVSLSGDTVQVASGTYNEDISLKSGVVLQGAGAQVTTLQGSGTGSVVTAIDVDQTTLIDGFTITGGGGGTGPSGGGGGIYCEHSSLTISNNSIYACQVASGFGGGIYLIWSPETKILNNTISDNCGFGGGGIFAEQSPGTVISCNIIMNNEALNYGAGIYASDTAQIENNIISGNHVGAGWPSSGGGIEAYGTGGMIINNTIVNNSAPGWGGGIKSSLDPAKQPSVVNCILWGNTGVDLYGCSATYSDIEDGNAGEGNISEDPGFVRGDSDNYRLRPGSPCIDSASPGGPTTDIEGRNRPSGSGYDMGAYEFRPTSNAPIIMLLLSEDKQ
ncbi:MAG: right-handed parallel beta-helix repeat-containing protein [Syntrophales bacterium]|nr:right-handed parallel beta-helix repeat-containing protein [Syntrophales bacterium]